MFQKRGRMNDGRKNNKHSLHTKMKKGSGCWWLWPVILATREAAIRWITFQSQPQVNILS
jgi:hypothetical protein